MKQELWPGQRIRILAGHPDPDYVGLKGITKGRAGAIREERDVKEKLSGLAFSILSTLDGCTADFPGFELIPAPHPDDKAYHEENGSDWWPPMPEDLMERDDIFTVHGGYMLHEFFYKKD